MTVLGGSALAQGRTATIDLRKVFDNYWRKKQAEAALKERQADIEKEDRNMRDDLKKAKEDYDALLAGANDQNLSPEEREKRKGGAQAKLKQMNDLKDTLDQYERTARNTVAEQTQRMRAGLLSEIRSVVIAKSKSSGYSMVIDIAAESVNSTPIILYNNNENDITDAILSQLNATAPADFGKSDDSAAKKDEKKEDKKDEKKN